VQGLPQSSRPDPAEIVYQNDDAVLEQAASLLAVGSRNVDFVVSGTKHDPLSAERWADHVMASSSGFASANCWGAAPPKSLLAADLVGSDVKFHSGKPNYIHNLANDASCGLMNSNLEGNFDLWREVLRSNLLTLETFAWMAKYDSIGWGVSWKAAA
jgi:hypothetical protein